MSTSNAGETKLSEPLVPDGDVDANSSEGEDEDDYDDGDGGDRNDGAAGAVDPFSDNHRDDNNVPNGSYVDAEGNVQRLQSPLTIDWQHMRTSLANERTFLAWTRTALSIFSFGWAILKVRRWHCFFARVFLPRPHRGGCNNHHHHHHHNLSLIHI